MLICMGLADAGVRDGTTERTKSDHTQSQARIATTNKRSANKTTVLPSRTAAKPVVNRSNSSQRTASNRSVSSRTATTAQKKSIISRSGTESTGKRTIADTRTGAEYEKCKTAYFSCMDQFCTLKSDEYRRCSCNDRVFYMIDQRKTLEDAHEQLTVFTESLEAVGMTASQATAMKQASEGENALISDKSASKALLQAIMNSISGKDTNVGGKYSELNSINISFDTANACGMKDAGQAIATYNGLALYNAVYPQCRQVVSTDCNDASLQRAITAYLMAIEQDCNTVQTAITTTQKQLKSAVREGSAMLDLARVENRKNHNSSDLSTCIGEIEAAVLSEEVCGKNYHKCLDNGEYIDISTGDPIIGITDFYKLGDLLQFADNVAASEQKLSKILKNRTFVQNFESRVKKFAEPALDKCVEKADIAWADYLDKALLDIYYAQRSKVEEIKQGCFDFVSSCYVNADKSITSAMQSLSATNGVIIMPDKLALTDQMCTEYVKSCDGMFGGTDTTNSIVAQYIESQKQTDTLTACRAVVKQCFDKYGGTNYENFYYPYSGLFRQGRAIDWFTLYSIKPDGDKELDTTNQPVYVSTCAKQLASISACNKPEIIEQAFGGFDLYNGSVYGNINSGGNIQQRLPRTTGVATETYNKVLSVLSTQCMNLQGRFVEYQDSIADKIYTNSTCYFASKLPDYTTSFAPLYGLGTNEYICPQNYDSGVDTASWGICSCWANGARRSQNNYTTKCVEVYSKNNKWESANMISEQNQVCVNAAQKIQGSDLLIKCTYNAGESYDSATEISNLPTGI